MISYSDNTVLKEVILSGKSEGLNVIQLSIFWRLWKDDPNGVAHGLTEYQVAILNPSEQYDLIDGDGWYYIDKETTFFLTEEGKSLINLIKQRKQTRYLLHKGCNLFPETANLLI